MGNNLESIEDKLSCFVPEKKSCALLENLNRLSQLYSRLRYAELREKSDIKYKIEQILHSKESFKTTSAEFISEFMNVMRYPYAEIVDVHVGYGGFANLDEDTSLQDIQNLHDDFRKQNPDKKHDMSLCIKIQRRKDSLDKYPREEVMNIPLYFDINMELTNGKKMGDYMKAVNVYSKYRDKYYTKVEIDQNLIKYLPITISIPDCCGCYSFSPSTFDYLKKAINNVYEKNLKQQDKEQIE